jgi:hypothetical protein
MTRLRASRRLRLIAALVATGIAVTGLLVVGVTNAHPAPVTVMTRNLYLGADITRPIRAAADQTGRDALLALGRANAELRQVVQATDFAVRGRLLAGEIADARPDLVGLQEVALWRHGPLDLDHLGRPDASTVDQDFLTILQNDLERRGVGYDVASMQVESDVEAPAFSGDPYTGTAIDAMDVRLTMRDVILIRRGTALTLDGAGGGQYQRRLEVTLGGVPYAFIRGYAWADLALPDPEGGGSTRFRFITTHLESQSGALAAAQAAELLAGPAGDRSRTTVVVCDCNANPPRAGAYRLLTAPGRLRDTWLRQPGAGPGFTATLGERVNDPTPAALDRRLDLVLVRPGTFGGVTTRAVAVTGDQTTDRDPATGLWPSDHAGVVVRLQIRGR